MSDASQDAELKGGHAPAGKSAYFRVNYNTIGQAAAGAYCKSIGMELAKIDNIGLHNSAEQYLTSLLIDERVWISATCHSLPCQWGDGEVLDWSNWRSSSEPTDNACAVLENENNGYPTWRTRDCFDEFISLCIAPVQPSFSLLSGLYNFYEASLACQAIGGQLAVVDNPETMERVTNELNISSDIWIGLYGNGINLVWQNTGKGMVYSNWDTSSPNTVKDVAVAMTQPNFQWTARPMTDQLSHALCQDPTNNLFPISQDIDQFSDVTTEVYPVTQETPRATIHLHHAQDIDQFSDVTTEVYPVTSGNTGGNYPLTPRSGHIKRYFNLDAEDAKPINQPYHTTQCQNEVRCASLCVRDQLCVAFVFNGFKCSLYTSFSSGSVNNVPGSTVWI
ncbi:CD206 [Mytilus edulis]|uniref:MRC n=1 Tax=Mytilus edulis TaxID=6550 RepID=A0A8S3S1P4_MYTED|nr:CD206 [Mytilus edulis]